VPKPPHLTLDGGPRPRSGFPPPAARSGR
jgi:hypothetical protein